VVEVTGMSAGYRGVAVVRDISLAVDEGEIVGLLGSNGAGKTTTLLTLSALVKPLSGEVQVLGKRPPTRLPHRLTKAGVSHVTESRNLFYNLSARDNLAIALTGSRRDRQAAMKEALELFPALGPLLGRRTALLSGGEQQMLALARALVSRPKLLLLDEMSLGLAPLIVKSLLVTVRDISEKTGCAIILVEQHVDLALNTVDRAYVLSNGSVAFSGSAAELKRDRVLLESSYLGDTELAKSAAARVVE
jgi:branched-chain amino acid transport system ATP-binding protein